MKSSVIAKLILLARIAIFIAVAYRLAVSELISEYWYVGPAFGAVVLFWHTYSATELVRPRSLAFLASSTLIYGFAALVIMDLDEYIPKYGDLFDAGFLGVMIGTTLLPIAHCKRLGGPWGRLKFSVPLHYVVWHTIVVAIDRSSISDNDFINAMSIWQALYLILMFAPAPRFLNREP
jgi:hypothetical protein